MFLTWADAGDHGYVVDGNVAETVLADDPLEYNLQERHVGICGMVMRIVLNL